MAIQQIIFIGLLAVVIWLASRSYGQILRNIRLGKPSKLEGERMVRLRNVALIAFGQQKMFKRIIPALLHLCVYVAFIFTQIELIEIIIDGSIGSHRLFAPLLGGSYTIVINTIEVLSILALVATLLFLWRRNIMRLTRFEKPEMAGWPKNDANIILLGEIVLIIGIFMMNGADGLLQALRPSEYPATGTLWLSSVFANSFFGGVEVSTLIIIERIGWWLHILAVFGFFLYLPISKHLHILLGFPNTYFARNTPKGMMSNMPEVMNEVRSMMGLDPDNGSDVSAEIPEFGAKDIVDLDQRHLLAAYSCTECGRCTSVCPANLTGKKLSPRKIMMDVRDRMEEVGDKWSDHLIEEKSNGKVERRFDDGRSLFDYISAEEINACTSCNACVEACPLLINPLDIILELRRYEILTRAAGPAEWMPMFTTLENSGAVWQVAAERDDWTNDLKVER
ncbi:MAG: (Fe-S)-binding protein [Saprospiraceae bacterium]|nr:(Fe-S)-binding protein [Saprospiraceae bacterium]